MSKKKNYLDPTPAPNLPVSQYCSYLNQSISWQKKSKHHLKGVLIYIFFLGPNYSYNIWISVKIYVHMFPFNSIKVKCSARSSYKFIFEILRGMYKIFQHRLYKDITKSTYLKTSKIVQQLIIKLNSRKSLDTIERCRYHSIWQAGVLQMKSGQWWSKSAKIQSNHMN